MTTDPTIYYLSFMKDKKFAGGCLVEAPDVFSAVERAYELKINPSDNVLALRITREDSDPGAFDAALQHLDKLFPTVEDLEAALGPTENLEERGRRLSE